MSLYCEGKDAEEFRRNAKGIILGMWSHGDKQKRSNQKEEKLKDNSESKKRYSVLEFKGWNVILIWGAQQFLYKEKNGGVNRKKCDGK